MENSNLIINYIDSLLSKENQKHIVLEFYIIENNLFLETDYKTGNNKVLTGKYKLNMEIEDIGLLYVELYNLLKDFYIENNEIKVQVLKEMDFSNFDNPYLSFKIHDVHQNEIDLRLRNFGNEKHALDTIENDLKKVYAEKITSRKH